MFTPPKLTLNILFCDDDAAFAARLSQALARKLALRFNLGSEEITYSILSSLDDVCRLTADTKQLKMYDMVFCDLGWAGLTLAGVQLLHDMQLAHPEIHTVLYTAQDENTAVSQALSWQLDFIDHVVKIDGTAHFEKMLDLIHSCFQNNSHDPKIKSGLPYSDKKLDELIRNQHQFPRVSDSTLLALDKIRFFSFIKKNYGGFPQMAEARRLDLNNIYRANRRFKHSYCVVFQYATIKEIVGVVDENESVKLIAKLLAQISKKC